MTTKEIVAQALRDAAENPGRPNRGSMVAYGQSFTPFIFNLTKLMRPPRVFEWGTGQSTHAFLLGDANVNVVSYESEKKWTDTYRRELQKLAPWLVDRVVFITAEDMALYTKPNFLDDYFDIVLVDGVDRTACFVESERIVRPGGVVLVHDAQRNDYGGDNAEKIKFYGYHNDTEQPQESTAIYIKEEGYDNENSEKDR